MFEFCLGFIIGATLGFCYRDLKDKIHEINIKLWDKEKENTKVAQSTPKSTILDPEDVAQRLKWEHAERQRMLNGEK